MTDEVRGLARPSGHFNINPTCPREIRNVRMSGPDPDVRANIVTFLWGMRFLPLFLLLFGSLNAQQDTFEQRLQEAQTLLEAKEYEQAREADRQILDREITPWERSVVRYHLGTIDYAEGDWERAITQWRKISLSEKSPPLLRQRVGTALALAELQLGTSSLYHLNRSLNHLREAEEAYCAYQQGRGANTCPSSAEIAAIRSAVKEAVDRLLTNQTPPKDDLALLLSGVEALKEGLQFLQSAQRSDYHSLYTRRALAWKPVMDRSSFNQVLAALDDGDYTAALKGLNRLEEELQEEVKHQLKVNGEQQAILMLLADYRRALAQQPLQQASIARLLQKKKVLSGVKTENLENSLEKLQQGKTDEARAYLLLAEYSLKQTQPQEKKGPQEVLKDGIDTQRTAFEMTQLSPDDRTLIHAMQKEVITVVAPFLKASFLKQRHDYNRRCQKSPWDVVFPLYDRGYQEALRAGSPDTSITDVIEAQEIALRNWEEALRYLKTPPPAPKEQEEDVDQVLRQLQEMEIQDVQPKPPIRLPKFVENPW